MPSSCDNCNQSVSIILESSEFLESGGSRKSHQREVKQRLCLKIKVIPEASGYGIESCVVQPGMDRSFNRRVKPTKVRKKGESEMILLACVIFAYILANYNDLQRGDIRGQA